MELQFNDMSDEDLVAASRSGDKNAFAALVRRHSKRVYAVCIGILGNPADSDDIFQETFVKGMTKIHTLRRGAQFAAWITQIARNLCRDHLRRHSRRRELLEQNPARPDPPVREEYDDLHAALEKLPEKHRLPLMLFYFDGRSSEKLAQELNLTRAGACTRLFRARIELQKLLAAKEESK
jgi:RNA polymerase sigma-70 factor (ECF subfamily)